MVKSMKRKSQTSSGSKKKTKTPSNSTPNSNHSNFLSQLQSLREFTAGCGDFTEADLSNCLRESAFNVQIAAERLITGQYKKSPSSSSGKSNFFQAAEQIQSTAKKQNPSSSNSTKSESGKGNGANRITSQKSYAKSVGVRKPLQKDASRANIQRSSASLRKPAANSLKPASRIGQKVGCKASKGINSRLLLCQRWVSAMSTTRNGSISYSENISIHASNISSSANGKNHKGAHIVRFKGSRIEGTLSTKLSYILSPLLSSSESFIDIEAKALMEDLKTSIGAEVPLELNIYILDAVRFFSLFDQDSEQSSPSNSGKEFWAKGAMKGQQTVKSAAFDLLQFSQYSSVPDFNGAEDNAKSDLDEGTRADDDIIDGKEEEEVDENGPSWASSLYSSDESKDENEPSEDIDPIMLKKKGITLRCYQRKALKWMMNREEHANENNNQEFQQQLTFLAELSASLRSKTGNERNGYINSLDETGKVTNVRCNVGPVIVSKEVAEKAFTLNGKKDLMVHPLWSRRFLWDREYNGQEKKVHSFYVNELLQTASIETPPPPKECSGGLLCDIMGLGKTVMLLSLLAKDRESQDEGDEKESTVIEIDDDDDNSIIQKKPKHKTTLVVAPLSLVAQWEEEIHSKSSLSCLTYYSDQAKKLGISDLSSVDVVITTYGMLQSELNSKSKENSHSSATLLSMNFRRVILDEAHIIKNPNTGASKACCLVQAERRWAVTGTPISNSLQDVYGLLRFLHHQPWCFHSFWKKAVRTPSITNDKEEKDSETSIVLERVRRLLKPILLRRTKDTLTSEGTPILSLPPIEMKVVSVELTDKERFFYSVLLSKSQSVFEGFIKSGTASKSWFAIFALLQRLRQSCDHLALTVKSRFDQKDMRQNNIFQSKSQSPAKEGDEEDFGGENDTFIKDLLESVRKQHGSTELASYSLTQVESLTQCFEKNEDLKEECAICLNDLPINDLAVTPCTHMFCRLCLINCMNQKKSNSDATTVCPVCQQEIDSSSVIFTQSTSSKKCKQEEGDEEDAHNLKSEHEYDAKEILESALAGKSSSKMDAIFNELEAVWRENPRSKVLVFSQYLGMFDLLQKEFSRRDITCLRLDGRMCLNERRRTVNKFNESKVDSAKSDEKGIVLLASMKACGVGLNLTAASSVFIVDPWWNDALEKQCINRIHRIGQTAELVRVRKFVVTDSVEEKIAKLQLRKEGMANSILDNGHSESDKPSLDDFKAIFGR